MSAEAYIEYAYLNYLLSAEFDSSISDEWIAEEDMVQKVSDALPESIKKFGYTLTGDFADLVGKHFTGMVGGNGIIVEGDEYTGRYARLIITNKDTYVKRKLAVSPVNSRLDRLGPTALHNAINAIAAEQNWQATGDVDAPFHEIDEAVPGDIVIPASDRFVTLGHNQQTELEEASSTVIDALEKENSVDGDPSARAWMLGQLKAGRELIRAQVVNAWLLEQTVLRVLGTLIENFRDHAIGAAAAVLMELLIKHIFGVS